MIVIISLSIIVISVGICCCISKAKYENSIVELSSDSIDCIIEVEDIQREIDRIDELKKNLREIRKNIDNLDIPTPESISSSDNAQSSLNKISCFFENHNIATVGTEQLILSLLPTSQLGESFRSLIHVIPPNVSHAIFGDALDTLKDGIHSIPTTEFLHRFIEGATHLSNTAISSMKYAMAHHDILGTCLTPIRSGALEALGVHDATQMVVSSLHDVSSEMLNTAATTVDVSNLTSVTDIDITGHVPIITIAISSFRESQLLLEDKTDYITALKNIALDAAGAGGGAIIGAKAGALAGGLLGPIGAILGGIVGGIGGAVGGRAIANNIKMKPLKNAIAEYESQYSKMKSETEEKSKSTAQNIQLFAERKRTEFHDAPLLEDFPIADTEQIVSKIALILYQFIVNELVIMESKTSELRKSIWYSAKKYDTIISSFEHEIDELRNQLPPVEYIKNSPDEAINTLLNLNMPNRDTLKAYQEKITECRDELRAMNDKNNASVLLWSYMVNNLYQKTLNDIADFSNKQMSSLNSIFHKWRETLSDIENKINAEKGKLGLS